MGNLFSKSGEQVKACVSGPPLYAELFDSIQHGKLDKLRMYTRDIPELYEARMCGKSVLHWSVLHAQTNCVEFLLQEGMDVNIQDDWGNPPIMELSNCKTHNTTKLQTVVDLLVKAKADINAINAHKRTVLLRSLINFRHQVAEILIDLGADTNLGDVDGLRPVHVCATYSVLPLLRKVIYNKADINAQDRMDRTALYFAIQAEHMEIVNELLKHRVDLNLGSQRPLQAAISNCRYDFVMSLIKHGACVNFKLSEHNFTWQRQILSKAKDCLNLALIVLHLELTSLQTEAATQNNIPKDRLIKAVQVMELVLQSYGDKVAVVTNVFLKSGKPRLISGLPNIALFRKLKTICRQLQFLHGMSHNFSSLPGEGWPSLEGITDCRSLQNLCRMELRKLSGRSGSNVVYMAEKLDCTVVVKDLLLLKDIV